MVPSLHQSNIYIKGNLLEWGFQKFTPYFSAKSPPRSADLQSTRIHAARYRASVAICGNSVLPFSKVLSLHQSNIYMKRKIREWRAENVILNSVHKAHLAVRTFKVPNSMQRGIGPSVAICENSGLRFAMVPSFHQSNIYIKRKLRKWSAHKCNPYFSAKSPPRSADLQSTRFHAARYKAVGWNL